MPGTILPERPGRRPHCNAIEPVSSRDFRLEMIFGQPPETASMSFEDSRSMVCVKESLTPVTTDSSSIVHYD